jgi:hypothetical protein
VTDTDQRAGFAIRPIVVNKVVAYASLAAPQSVRRTILSDAVPVVICVPARNEERALPALLHALSLLKTTFAVPEVCIYLDGCDDGSEALLRHAASKTRFPLSVMTGEARGEANAGAARRAAVAMGLTRLGERDGYLFITDADTTPRRDWIEAGQAALAQADVVAGRIVRRQADADPTQSRIEQYYDRLHLYRRLLDPVPWEAQDTHHFSGGANMAVRASVYQRIGGFRPLVTGEDATFLDDAARAGFRVRRDGSMMVDTSSRRIGRVAGGLAGALRALDAGAEPLVPHPRGAAWQWQAQAAAKDAFNSIKDADVRAALGKRLGLSADHVLGVARDCRNAEAFAMRVVPPFAGKLDMISLAQAEDALIALQTEPCEAAA